MGYEAVETGAVAEMEPKEYARFLKSIGLKVAGVHSGVNDFLDAGGRGYKGN
jgi:hypothetical protein